MRFQKPPLWCATGQVCANYERA